MRLDRNTWHARWFHFVQNSVGNKYRYSEGTNLCHYMRVTLLWGPLWVSFVATGLGAALFIVCVPFIQWGILGGLALYGSLIAFLGGIVGIALLVEKFRYRRRRQINPNGFPHLIGQYVKAIKGRFCPMISFDDQHPAE